MKLCFTMHVSFSPTYLRSWDDQTLDWFCPVISWSDTYVYAMYTLNFLSNLSFFPKDSIVSHSVLNQSPSYIKTLLKNSKFLENIFVPQRRYEERQIHPYFSSFFLLFKFNKINNNLPDLLVYFLCRKFSF